MSPAAGRRQRGRAIALAALLVVVAGVVAVGLAANSSSSGHHAASTQARVKRTVASTATHTRPATRRPASATTSAPAQTSSTASSPEALTAAQLQARGHQQMLSGEYQTAIGTLRQAVSSSDPSSLTYAYALYDLGRSLVLGGDPSGAIPVLQQRLKIPNQTPVVRQLLDQALRAAGQLPAQSPTPTTPGATTRPGKSEGHGRGHPGPTGGAGLPAPSDGQGNGHGKRHVVEHISVSFVE